MLGWWTGVRSATLSTMTRSYRPRPLEFPHEHTTACWWDHREARLVCPTQQSPDPVVERPLVDVRDMVVVHTALLREFRLAPVAVARVPAGDAVVAARVDRHLQLLCSLLHHHHQGEDDLLWPALRPLLPAAAMARLDDAEAQHAAITHALEQVCSARERWRSLVDDSGRNDLTAALEGLYGVLAEHLDAEERTLLPLAAAHLTQQQWDAVGRAGAAAVPRSRMLLVFGMFCYEGDPAVLADMLRPAPLPVRVLVPLLAPRVYARHAARLYGTAQP